MNNTIFEFKLGDILEFKKNHPCGSKTWKVIRYGVDCKLECTTCGRIVMIPRKDIAKKVKRVVIINNDN